MSSLTLESVAWALCFVFVGFCCPLLSLDGWLRLRLGVSCASVVPLGTGPVPAEEDGERITLKSRWSTVCCFAAALVFMRINFRFVLELTSSHLVGEASRLVREIMVVSVYSGWLQA